MLCSSNFKKDMLLYHYTSAESFFKIISTLSLKCSSFSKLNDLQEMNFINIHNIPNFLALNKLSENNGLSLRLLCFSQNYKLKGQTQKGSNLPRMWAQYAANNTGVCISIDKGSFLKENSKKFKNKFIKFKNLHYTHFGHAFDDSKIIKSINDVGLTEFIKIHSNDLFFQKFTDWKDEHEHRFIGIDTPEYLSIQNSIKSIILGNRFFCDDYLMKQLVLSIPLSDTMKSLYINNQIYISTPSIYGYIEDSAIPLIKSVADKMSISLDFY